MSSPLDLSVAVDRHNDDGSSSGSDNDMQELGDSKQFRCAFASALVSFPFLVSTFYRHRAVFCPAMRHPPDLTQFESGMQQSKPATSRLFTDTSIQSLQLLQLSV